MDKHRAAKVVCLKNFGCAWGLADSFCACRPSAGWPKEGQRFTPVGIERDEDGEFFQFAEYLPEEFFLTKYFRELDEVEKLEELAKEAKGGAKRSKEAKGGAKRPKEVLESLP